MIGTTIGHYTIEEKLGEGGMGVVYKAHDTKLDRTVALKFLPDRVTQNDTEKARFLQEAKAAAALNHPHICTIHYIEEEKGSLFIVMEYVDGGTLRNKIPYAKPDDAIAVAIQIGEALQEAHSKGIVHRDVKADNVMLTSKGQAKVMDFGLAKLKGSLKLTKTSSTVGTLGYMAPEQIQGGTVDHRSDIFSFGVLLFEMLAGKLPFRGEHEAAMVYSIVNEDPQDVAQLVPDLSPLVVNLIQRCLEKDPEDRYQTMQDAVSELRRSQKKTTRVMRQQTAERKIVAPEQMGGRPADAGGTSATVAAPADRKKIFPMIGVAVVLLAAAAWWFTRSSLPQLNPEMTFRTIQMPFTVFQYPGFSADGNWIVFPAADASGKWDLYWMHNAGGDARRVTFDSSLAPRNRWLSAQISPDGSQIVYNRVVTANGVPELAVVSSNGGVGRKIAQAGLEPLWRPDGERIGFIGVSDSGGRPGVLSVKPDGTDLRTEFVDAHSAVGNISFSWSPDGKSVAWIRSFSNNTSEVITVDLQSHEEKQLTHDGKNLDEVCWTPRGYIIFSSSRSGNTNLWAIPAGGGEEIQITKGAGPDLGVKVSTDGRRLLYYQNQDIGNIWSANGDGSNLRQITFDDQNITGIALSPDGKNVVFAMAAEQGFSSTQVHLYTMDRNGGNRRQLTFGDEVSEAPEFSPDGLHVAFRSRRTQEPGDSANICVIDFPNASTPRVLHAGTYPVWMANEEVAVWHSPASWRANIHGGTPQKLLQDSLLYSLSEEGKFTTYYDIREGSRGLWTLDAKSGKRTKLSSATGGLIRPVPNAGLVCVLEQDNALYKIHGRDGKKEKLTSNLLGVTVPYLIGMSRDAHDMMFINKQSRGKLVMIDNLFK